MEMLKAIDKQSESWDFQTLAVNKESGVLFVEMKAPPMNMMGPELIGDLATLITRAEADTSVKVIVFKRAIRIISSLTLT